MLDVILIDDEPKAIQNLAWEISNFCINVKVVESFTNANLAKAYLDENDVDCVFLDIEMPGIDGFQFLDLFPNRDFAVVITTAYDQYAIKAIKERALDYLLKPIDSDDLIQCFEKIRTYKKETSLNSKLEKTLTDIIRTSQSGIKKISVSCDGKIIFLMPEEIVYCESDGNYCTIFLEGRDKIFVTQKLKYIEEKLTDDCFFRVHNSFLVNLTKVKEYHKTDEYLVLSNNKKIPVSRQKKASFLDRL